MGTADFDLRPLQRLGLDGADRRGRWAYLEAGSRLDARRYGQSFPSSLRHYGAIQRDLKPGINGRHNTVRRILIV